MKSVESHYVRALLTSRKVMQRKCIDLENEIRGLLKIFGVKLPMRLRGGAFDAVVRDTIESDPALSHALLPMLQARQMLLETFLELDRRVNPGRISPMQATLTSDTLCSRQRDADAVDCLEQLEGMGVRLMKTKGRRRAIVAVARKIAVVLHRMWVDGTEFRFGSEASA